MNVEVDQSGKIGQTDMDTILAFSNGKSYTIRIPKRVKRTCLHELRERGIAHKTIYLQLFATALYFLLKEHITQMDLVLIDMEYPGQEKRIKEHLLNLFRRAKLRVNAHQITFGYVGKRSKSHVIAIATYRGKRKADVTLTTAEILAEFRKR